MGIPKPLASKSHRIAGRPKLFFNVHQSIVLSHSLAATGGARFKVARTKADSEVGNEIVGGLAGAV